LHISQVFRQMLGLSIPHMETVMYISRLFRQILDFRIHYVHLECSHVVTCTFAVLLFLLMVGNWKLH